MLEAFFLRLATAKGISPGKQETALLMNRYGCQHRNYRQILRIYEFCKVNMITDNQLCTCIRVPI